MDKWIVVWTEPAVADLQSIMDHIAADNPTAAIGVVNQIIQRVELLANTPRMGKRYIKYTEFEIREIVSGKYRVFYRLHDDSRVEILAIWHSARGDPDLLIY